MPRYAHIIHKQSINFEESRPSIKTRKVDGKKFYFFTRFIHLNYFQYHGFKRSWTNLEHFSLSLQFIDKTFPLFRSKNRVHRNTKNRQKEIKIFFTHFIHLNYFQYDGFKRSWTNHLPMSLSLYNSSIKRFLDFALSKMFGDWKG